MQLAQFKGDSGKVRTMALIRLPDLQSRKAYFDEILHQIRVVSCGIVHLIRVVSCGEAGLSYQMKTLE